MQDAFLAYQLLGESSSTFSRLYSFQTQKGRQEKNVGVSWL
jgi:hypothetical protein